MSESISNLTDDVDANLGRAMQEARARLLAAKQLSTLTKAELADLLFEQVGLNKREAKEMVETFFEEIRNALERGEAVKLSGFGNFQLRDKPAVSESQTVSILQLTMSNAGRGARARRPTESLPVRRPRDSLNEDRNPVTVFHLSIF